MATTPILLIHGAATTSAVWRHVIPFLAEHAGELRVPDRPCSGDLAAEVDFLEPLADGAIVAGVSGGATLGWELLSRSAAPAGAVLHEPAAGSLRPGLLDDVLRRLDAEGPAAFAEALYGPAWTHAELGDPATVTGDVGMFAGFEPRAPHPDGGPVTLTVGGSSPAARHEVAEAYRSRFGVASRTLPGVRHAAHLEDPGIFAAEVLALARTV